MISRLKELKLINFTFNKLKDKPPLINLYKFILKKKTF